MKRYRHAVAAAALLAVGCAPEGGDPASGTAAPSATSVDAPAAPTYAADVASILYANCAACHREGENAPFTLTSYEDARRRARQIAEVVTSGYMPPWPPSTSADEPARFHGQRGLTQTEVTTLTRWFEQGAERGDAAAEPPPPSFAARADGWTLGPPDLVVEMPEAYVLGPRGDLEQGTSSEDVYRNFVIESPVTSTRHVRAIEFRPGNARVVHHAFVLVDSTDGSRRQDEADPGPGFDGIHPPETALTPGGFFLSWTPGRVPFAGERGLSWALEADTDIVLQVHMQPSGKTEEVRASVGFYFDEGPPTRRPVTLGLFSKEIDIPAGEGDYHVEVEYRLPVDVDVLAVLPHAHFLGKSMRGLARTPDGERVSLIEIPEWDFNWQEAYRYLEPVRLPRGTVLELDFAYDNSRTNPRNPNVPPARVTYGLDSVDEMCELWLQVLPRNPADGPALQKDFDRILMQQVAADARRSLAENPDDAQSHLRLAQTLVGGGKLAEAESELREALRLDPTLVDATLLLADLIERSGRRDEARRQLGAALSRRPAEARLHFALGSLHYRANELKQALPSYLEAVRLAPDDFRSRLQLGVTHARMGNLDGALACFERCVELRPDDPDARKNLEQARRMKARRR